MSSEVLLSNIIPIADSGLVGYAIGFALKKILKWMLIIGGFLAGMFFLGLQLLQKYGYVSTVNWETALNGVVFKSTTQRAEHYSNRPYYHIYNKYQSRFSINKLANIKRSRVSAMHRYSDSATSCYRVLLLDSYVLLFGHRRV